MFNFPLLMGAPAGSSGSSQGSIVQIGMIVAVFAVFWFLIIRPQRKKQKDEKTMREAIKKGDRITSIGGIRGTVKNVSETSIIVEVDNKGATLEFTKSAVGTVEASGDAAAAKAAPAKKSKASKEDDSQESSEQK